MSVGRPLAPAASMLALAQVVDANQDEVDSTGGPKHRQGHLRRGDIVLVRSFIRRRQRARPARVDNPAQGSPQVGPAANNLTDQLARPSNAGEVVDRRTDQPVPKVPGL